MSLPQILIYELMITLKHFSGVPPKQAYEDIIYIDLIKENQKLNRILPLKDNFDCKMCISLCKISTLCVHFSILVF